MAKAPVTTTGPENDLPAIDVLASGHQSHAVNAVNLLRAHGYAYGAAIDALESEKLGQIAAFDKAKAELEEKHETSILDLNRRIADLQLASDMMEAGLKRHDAPAGLENKQ